jgi:hypothetical protein
MKKGLAVVDRCWKHALEGEEVNGYVVSVKQKKSPQQPPWKFLISRRNLFRQITLGCIYIFSELATIASALAIATYSYGRYHRPTIFIYI